MRIKDTLKFIYCELRRPQVALVNGYCVMWVLRSLRFSLTLVKFLKLLNFFLCKMIIQLNFQELFLTLILLPEFGPISHNCSKQSFFLKGFIFFKNLLFKIVKQKKNKKKFCFICLKSYKLLLPIGILKQ